MYFLGSFFLRHLVKPWFPVFRDTQLLLEWALTSSALVLILLAIRYLFRNKLSARWRYALWAVVLVRLLVPFQLQLPAAASQAVPLVASNLTPEPPTSWDERDIPLFSAGEQPIEEAHPYYQVLQPGYLGPGPWSDGYIGLSEDGKTVTAYADIFTRNEVIQSIWWVGVLGMSAVLLVSNLRFLCKLEKRRRPLEGAEAPIPVYTAEGLPSPCLFGAFRPAVYVIPGAAEDTDALRHVLAHELTHYAHKDHIWSLLRCLALALHWYDPLVWLAVVLSKRDGELACDEGAVARLGEEERIPYGRTLVDMVARRSARPADLLSCSTAMTGSGKSIQERVARLVKHPETVKTALFAAIAVVALSVVFVFATRTEDNYQERSYSTFLSDVKTARSIHLSQEMISSYGSFTAITDPKLLEQAKGILRQGTKDWLDPPPIIENLNWGSLRTLTITDQTGQEIRYQLVRSAEKEGQRFYVITEGSFSSVSRDQIVVLLDRETVSLLEELTRKQAELLRDPSLPRSMSQDELSRYNVAFLRNIGIEQLQGQPDSMESAVFHAGITSPGEIQLWYWGDEDHYDVWVLALDGSAQTVVADQPIEVFNAIKNAEEEEVHYEQLGPGAFAASLRGKDIAGGRRASAEHGYLPWYQPPNFSIIPTLKDQLIQALYHQRNATYSQEKYGLYSFILPVKKDVNDYLNDGGTDGLILSIGTEPDVVCISHRILASPQSPMRQYLYSPELYRTVQDLFPQTEQIDPFEHYLFTVHNAVAVDYHDPSPFHSDEVFEPIVDYDLLPNAKTKLSDMIPIDQTGGPVPDPKRAKNAPQVTICPTSDRAYGQTYRLLLEDGYTYLLPLKEDIILARSAERYELAEFIKSLSRKEYTRRLQGEEPQPVRILTQEELDRANEAFQTERMLDDGSFEVTEISCFFTSSYTDPTWIHLGLFLQYCPLSESVTKEQSPEEYRDVLEVSPWAEEASDPDFFMPVPIHRYPREKVSALLQKYTGVTVEDLNWGDVIYLEKYNAFYNFTSDYGPGFFSCTEGRMVGDTIVLRDDPRESGERSQLTIRKSGDDYFIQSFSSADH